MSADPQPVPAARHFDQKLQQVPSLVFIATLTGYEEMILVGAFDEEPAARSAAAAAWFGYRRWASASSKALDVELGYAPTPYREHLRPRVYELPHNASAVQWWEHRMQAVS